MVKIHIIMNSVLYREEYSNIRHSSSLFDELAMKTLKIMFTTILAFLLYPHTKKRHDPHTLACHHSVLMSDKSKRPISMRVNMDVNYYSNSEATTSALY